MTEDREIPLPLSFFSEVLPQVQDVGLLKLMLYAYWARSARGSRRAGLCLSDLTSDQRWLQGFGQDQKAAAEASAELLERLVHRGFMLRLDPTDDGESHHFLNDSEGRRRRDAALEMGVESDKGTGSPSLHEARPNIYVLYEQNIGPLTPMLSERLRAAEQEYPLHWIEEAVRIAVTNNVRKWRYIEAILDDWQTKGRDERRDQGDTAQARKRYVEGRFSDYIEH